MRKACQETLAEHGYTQYEVSAYAQPERGCAHNLNYWRFGDLSGSAQARTQIDPTRHITVLRRWKIKHPQAYLDHAHGAQRIGGDEYIALDARPFEFMLNALRLNRER